MQSTIVSPGCATSLLDHPLKRCDRIVASVVGSTRLPAIGTGLVGRHRHLSVILCDPNGNNSRMGSCNTPARTERVCGHDRTQPDARHFTGSNWTYFDLIVNFNFNYGSLHSLAPATAMRASASLAWMLAVMCLEARDGRGFCSDSSEFGGWGDVGEQRQWE